MAETKYCGKGKHRSGKWGEEFAISISPNDLEVLNSNKNDGGWVNVKMTPLKEPDKRGNTWTLKIDDWKPNATSNGNDKFYKSNSQPTEHSVDKGNGYVKETSHRYSEEDRPQGQVSKATQNQDVKENEEDDIPF